MRPSSIVSGTITLTLASTAHAACPTDLDQNGQTDVDDLIALLTDWGQSGQADFDGDGSMLHIDFDGAPLTGAVSISPTGGWQSWTTIRVGPFDLPVGEHVLMLHVDDGDFNLDWMLFE